MCWTEKNSRARRAGERRRRSRRTEEEEETQKRSDVQTARRIFVCFLGCINTDAPMERDDEDIHCTGTRTLLLSNEEKTGAHHKGCRVAESGERRNCRGERMKPKISSANLAEPLLKRQAQLNTRRMTIGQCTKHQRNEGKTNRKEDGSV